MNLSWSGCFLGAKQRNFSLRLILLEAGFLETEMGHCLLFKLKCNIPLVICVLTHVRLFVTPWTAARRLLCPWDSAGKTTRAGCRSLLQGIFPAQGIEPTPLASPALAGWLFIPEPLGKPCALSL